MRKSFSTEEKARDLLVDFLSSPDRKPLSTFINLFVSEEDADGFKNVKPSDVRREDPSINQSRADIVIEAESYVLCIEVKVDAAEQLGQYVKYRDHLRCTGKTVCLGGLVKRFKSAAAKNDDTAFLEAMGVKRLLWSELLCEMEQIFGELPEYKIFVAKLKGLSPNISRFKRPPRQEPTEPLKEAAKLASDNRVLANFYSELGSHFPTWDPTPVRYGNSPYELHLGKPAWSQLFQESCCRRIVVALRGPPKGKLHPGPYFAICVILWNRSWFKDELGFLDNRHHIVTHFCELGFEVRRNQGSGWHGEDSWQLPDLDAAGLKYANAFWDDRFSLPLTRCLGWSESIKKLTAEIERVAKMIDSLQAVLER